MAGAAGRAPVTSTRWLAKPAEPPAATRPQLPNRRVAQPAECGPDARRRPSGARRRIGRYVEHAATEPTQQTGRNRLAGAGGFEPPDARSKVSCLTTWPRPTNRTGFPLRSFRAARETFGCASGVMAIGPRDDRRGKARGGYRGTNSLSNRWLGSAGGRGALGPASRWGGRDRAASRRGGATGPAWRSGAGPAPLLRPRRRRSGRAARARTRP
jgi:hypothetical protein